mgnify:CR=1 FL=1
MDEHVNKSVVDSANSTVSIAIQDGSASAKRVANSLPNRGLAEFVRKSLLTHTSDILHKDGLTERELLLKVREDTKAAETFFHSVMLTLDARITELD